MIAKFKKTAGGPVVILTSAAIVLLATTDLQSGKASEPAGPSNVAEPPHIVSTNPKLGETDVNPSLTEIYITFDRNMGGGFSWTGGPADFPSSPEGKKAKWSDKRTCMLPVKLDAARYYRVGINYRASIILRARMVCRRIRQPFTSRPGAPAKR